MRKRILFVFLAQLFVIGMQAQVSFGKAERINNDWYFMRIDTLWNAREYLRTGERLPGSRPDMKDADFDDSRWRQVTLPHDWGVEQPMSPDKGSCQGYLPGGIGWYRKHFRATDAPKQYVYFEGVYNNSEVYLNGHLLGKRPSGFASFMYDITSYLNKTGENVLAVRVNHSEENDSRWYTGSGIYRNVWLISAPEVHLSQWGTAYRLKKINKKKAELEVDVETADCRTEKSPLQLKATVELKDAEGKIVAKTERKIGTQEKVTVKLQVPNPQRWTLDNPYLYSLTTRLSNGDVSEVRVGLRTLQFSADKGFALNGEWMKVKGVCVHDDAGVLGTAVPKEVWRRRIAELKALGTNALRLSHNPHAPELYDLCDEMGMLIMDEASDEWEFPKRKCLKGWNQGAPGFQGTYSYFEEWIDRDVADMVRRDRCHPSVFMWSIGNEVDYPNDPYSHPVLNGSGTEFTQPVYGGYKPEQPNAERIGIIAQRLAKIVRDIDTSRPTTGALAGVVMSNETAYPEAIDVVGYNYTESRYGIDHEKYPKRILYGSENRHDLAAWKAVSENEHIFGQFLWTGIDYLGESGVWPARGSSAGLLDLAGQRKPNGWYRASLWSDKPVCYIGTYPLGPQRYGSRQNNQRFVSPYANDTWNYEDEQKVRVVCYSNAKSLQLILNGNNIGGEPTTDAATGIRYWDIEYAPGTLSCVADNGSSYEVKTTKTPYTLKISTDSLTHIFVEVVDEDGNLVKNADNEILLNVRGARLLGMENGNMADITVTGRQRPNRLRVYGGRLVAYFVPQADSEHIIIRASSPLLPNPTAVMSFSR